MREQNGLTTMEETSGTRFGNYELVRRIDVGGMGEVYLARQLTAFNRTVAIKIIRSDLVHDTTARTRFLREAEVSAHLKHEHILALFDFGEVDGRLYLVTPYIEGGTLATRLKTSGPLSLKETHKLFVPLVQAVAYIHRRGVVHRDLKPTNILLDSEDGEVYVRLIDFGIATLQGRSASPPLTTAGHELGTVAYMAPERLSGIAAPSNDIFSLGVILHQMLTGRMPPAASAPSNPEIPALAAPIAEVIRRAVAAKPDERYASADELLKAFELAYEQTRRPVPVKTAAAEPEETILAVDDVAPEQPKTVAPPELVSLAHSGELSALETQTPTPARRPVRLSFAPEDYEAPTAYLRPQRPMVNNRPPLLRPRPPKQRNTAKRSSLFMIVSVATVIVLAILSLMLYYGYQIVDATSVSINFAPRSQVISKVVTLKADPRVSAVHLSQGVIPEPVPVVTQENSQSATTTGRVNCQFGLFDCMQGVSPDDVANLVQQMKPDLDQNITQLLKNKVAAAHGTQISSINIFNQTITSTPPVGQPGNTVTVKLSEQGSVGYFLNRDVTNAAHQALTDAATQLGPNYQLVDSTANTGTTKIQAIDPNTGVTSIAVSAGAVALYHFTDTELQAISQGLLGKSQEQARAFLQSQPGIDPASIAINFTSGSQKSMPSDTQHIKLIPISPTSLPNVPLTPITGQAPGATPSGTPGATNQ